MMHTDPPARGSSSLFSDIRGMRHELGLLKREMCELELIQSAFTAADGKENARVTLLTEQIRDRALRLTDMYEGFETAVSEVDNAFDRSALTLRYLYGMTWLQVAFALGEHDEQYARRRCEKYTGRAKLGSCGVGKEAVPHRNFQGGDNV